MAFSGGVFSRLYDWTTDRDNGVKILASRMDEEFDGMATGLSTCILKDGTQTCTAAVPFAEGLTIPDDKTLVFGTDSDVTIQYDETTNNALEIAANVEGAALGVVLKADQGDDNADQWKVNVADGGTLSINSKISGSFVSQLTLTPNATAASSTTAIAGNITVGGTVDGRDLATDGSKLDGIEASADVTDTANVTAAGALMDSEVTNLAQVKAFDSADYATAAQGSTADSALQNVSEDTTPQLGGNLDTNGNDINFGDDDKAIFGAGSDLQIYHDGSDSYIKENGTGALNILGQGQINLLNSAGDETLAKFLANNRVELYYDNSKKFETTATGIDVTGNAAFDDNGKAIFGAGSDLQIWHDGSNSFVKDAGTGSLRILGDELKFLNAGDNQLKLTADTNGAVKLYYSGTEKLATTATGVTVTGTALATTDTDTTNSGNVTLDFGANQNFVLTLTGNVTLDNPTTEQVGQSGFIVFIQDATGGRTVSLGTDYETAGGAGLTLSTAASTTDIVPYVVAASGRILLGTPQLAFA